MTDASSQPDGVNNQLDDLDEPFEITAEDVPGIKKALAFYRVMAYVVGVLLVVLVLVAMPLKYFGDDGRLVVWTGIPHGWLYMVLLISAYNLGRRVGWSLKWFVLIMAAGTVPFLSFVAEHYARKDVQAKLAEVEPA